MLSLTAKVIPARVVGEEFSMICARSRALLRGTKEIQIGLSGCASKRSYIAETLLEIFIRLPPGEMPIISAPRRPTNLARSAVFQRYLRSAPLPQSPFSSLRAQAISARLPPSEIGRASCRERECKSVLPG